MSHNVPAMLDCMLANIIIQFTDGRVHTESIEFDGDTFETVCEIEYMLFRYQQDGIRNQHDLDAWIELCLGGPGRVPTDEQEAAAETIVAIFDTYLTNNSTDLDDYEVHMVDHKGNQVPYQIDRQ